MVAILPSPIVLLLKASMICWQISGVRNLVFGSGMLIGSVWFPAVPGKANPTADSVAVFQDLRRCRLILWICFLGEDFLDESF